MEKVWLEHYPRGVVHEISEDNRTLNDLLDEVCAKYPNNRAITSHNESISFATFQKYVNNFAASLAHLGVGHGDRVAVILPNIMQYPISIFAILRLGAVVVNINPLYTEHEIDYLLENSGCKIVVVLNLIAAKLDKLYSKHHLEHVIVTQIPDPYPYLKRLFMNFAIRYIKKRSGVYSYKAQNFRELMLCRPRASTVMPKTHCHDLAFIQYTSATTGKPKGAMLLHKNIVANINQVHAWLVPQISNLDQQVVINALPLYHIFSLTANLFTFLFTGSENIMILNPHDTADMVKILNQSKFTIFSALDTLYSHLLQSKEFKSHKYPAFKYSVAGGMASRESVMREWFAVTKVMPTNCYGLTEASPAVTLNPLDNSYDGTVGYPMPSTDLEIRDLATGKVLNLGEAGLVWVKGPQIMEGYWHNPEQTQLAFDMNGWFNTHDIGYLSKEGKLTLVSRYSDMIIVSGFNVYPAEVEAVLDTFVEVHESAVLGVKHAATGEMIVAFLVLKPGYTVSAQEVITRCHHDLSGYKVPSKIYFVNSLPKTLIGKVDKKALAATMPEATDN